MINKIINAVVAVAVIVTLVSLVAVYNVTKDIEYKSPLSNCVNGFCDMTSTTIDNNGYFVTTTTQVWVGKTN